MSTTMDRRHFMTALGGSITVLLNIDVRSLLAEPTQGRGYPTDLNAYLRIGEDGRIALFTGKIEMGQGVNTSLGQMLADELDVPLNFIDPVMGDTDVCPWDMGTFGSMTTRFFGPPLRRAGAEARSVLVQLAAERLQLPADRLDTRDGFVFDKQAPATRVGYGELVKGQKIERQVTAGVQPEPVAEHEVCNRPAPRIDAEAKVTGAAQYAGDIRLPGMLYGAVLRPPAHGARMLSVDTSGAEAISGARIIRDGDLVAVLHSSPDGAMEALTRVKAEWDVAEAQVTYRNIFEHLQQELPRAQSLAEAGTLGAGEAAAAKVEEVRYLNHYVAHSPMETHTACAQVEGGKVTVWAGTQTPFPCRDEVARELGLSPESVRVITPYVGGGFGGKTYNLQAVEAARLAKLSGSPVQVCWSRAEEFFHDRFRPAAVVRVRSGVDSAGRLALWDLETLYAGTNGAEPLYDIPNVRVQARGGWQGSGSRQPLAVGPWRAPGANTNVFAVESQIERMAVAAGEDPVAFRLKHLKDERARRVLRTAAERFGGSFARTPSGRGIGVAVSSEVGAFDAAIAQVSVDRASGNVKVERIVCVQDMGEIINPRGAQLQVEGCLTMGLGYALTEQVRFEGGRVLEQNFDSYLLPRFSWVPTIEVTLLDSPGIPPQGGGEAAIPLVGAMIANAIHDACGAWLVELPMTPARVKAALTAIG